MVFEIFYASHNFSNIILLFFILDYKCNCLDWTIGKNCESTFNPCQVSPCNNGGTCSKRRTLAFECACSPDFTGLRCNQKKAESCLVNTCKKGKCEIDSTGNYSCKCDGGFEGTYCDEEQCNPKCSKNGKCTQTELGFYRCECKSGYKGADCSSQSA